MIALICGVTDKVCEFCDDNTAEVIVGERQLCKDCVETTINSIEAIRIDVAYAHRQLAQWGDKQRALDAVERIKANLS